MTKLTGLVTKNALITLMLLIASALFAACGGGGAEPAEQAAPTQAPKPTVTTEPAAVAAVDPTASAVPEKSTEVHPTATKVPDASTVKAPTATAAPEKPAATEVRATATSVPSTATSASDPTATAEPAPLSAFTEFAEVKGAIIKKTVFDDETIWVIDRDNSSLIKMSAEGEILGSTFKPQAMFDLELDSEFVYVADPMAGKIVQYDSSGEEVSRRTLLLEISNQVNHIELDGSDLWVLTRTKLKRLSFDGGDDFAFPVSLTKTTNWLIGDGNT